MSRERSRPTRAETRSRLLEAAADVFTEKGIPAATIEDICAAAGFSRGAFYSNFTAKDELVLEILEEHLTANLAEIDRLYDRSDNAVDFIRSMESEERRRTDPTKGNGLLYMELILYALRNPENRPALVARQRKIYAKTREIVARIEASVGVEMPGRLDDMVALILGFDDGILLHQLIDPDSYRPGQYADTMSVLYGLWMAGAEGASEPTISDGRPTG